MILFNLIYFEKKKPKIIQEVMPGPQVMFACWYCLTSEIYLNLDCKISMLNSSNRVTLVNPFLHEQIYSLHSALVFWQWPVCYFYPAHIYFKFVLIF